MACSSKKAKLWNNGSGAGYNSGLNSKDLYGNSSGNGSFSESELARQNRLRFGNGEIPDVSADGRFGTKGGGLFKDVRFAYDSSVIDPMAREAIQYNYQVLAENPSFKIQLEGHCDERGTAEYNMALGAQRAKAVLDELRSLGIDSSRLDSISYGEELPMEMGSSEQAWTQNRRVHFAAYQ